jgi:hypothetical protein
MKRAVLLVALAFAACGGDGKGLFQPKRWHDDEKRVTCWTWGESISCIPDRQLESP